jgi:ComF family protein
MGVMLMAGGRLSTSKIHKVNNWLQLVHDWLLPPACVLCGREGHDGRDLCRACAAELPYLETACRRCAIPLPQAGICGRCQQKSPTFDVAHAVFDYSPPVAQLIQRLKFNGKLYNARLLGGLMAERLAAAQVELPELIVPVPLHTARLRERGFNQALELARPLARGLGVPLAAGLCRRRQATAPQTGLDARARRRNLKGAFEVCGTSAGHVALVDDVMTTGSTVEVLARALKRAGVGRVDVWLCARAALRH